MSAMGLGGTLQQLDAPLSTLPIRAGSSPMFTPKGKQPHMTPPVDNYSALSAQRENFTSNPSPQPSPKRAKPRKSFKMPTLEQQAEPVNPHSRRSAGRYSMVEATQPLRETCVNLSPKRTKSPSKATSIGNAIAKYHGLEAEDGWSFMTGALKGTPLVDADDAEDESTVDL